MTNQRKAASCSDLEFAEMSQGSSRTFAYWMGPVRPDFMAKVVSHQPIISSMRLQYDVEDQVGATGRLFYDVDWREHFHPLAPVQLTSEWSPFPAACDVLGPPGLLLVGEGALGEREAVATWALSQQDRRASLGPASSADARRFSELLEISIARARERNWLLLLAGKPGWSYSHAIPFDRSAVDAMQKAGFVVFDRKKAL